MKRYLFSLTFSVVQLAMPPSCPAQSPDQAPTPAPISREHTSSPDRDAVLEGQVDQLFSHWNKPDSPGGAIAIVRNGDLLFQKGYGQASLEFGIANTPSTIFHAASISKQFTAFAIYLLEKDGRLSTSDDVRKYIPELHNFGRPITIRNLLHHTSGLRDQWGLLNLAGWRIEDTITEDDVLQLIWKQRELNFEPGTKYAYSNTNYTLLATIVQRVAGRPFAQFMHDRIFEPLGMANSYFQDDAYLVRKGHASPYGVRDKGYQRHFLAYSTVGPTGLQTTVQDMALWEDNFRQPKIGNSHVNAQMLRTETIDKDKPNLYASGLIIGKYRGLDVVEHSGNDPGYQSYVIRFPAQGFAVVILGNTDLQPWDIAHKVADLYLMPELMGVHEEARPQVHVAPEILDRYVGTYELDPGVFISFSKSGNDLIFTGRGTLTAHSSSDFSFRNTPFQFTFKSPAKNGAVNEVVLHWPSFDQTAPKIKIADRAGPPGRLTSETMRTLEGDYYSPELSVLYVVQERDGKLMLTYPRGTVELKQRPDGAGGSDAFATIDPLEWVEFSRFSNGDVRDMRVSPGLVQNLRFVKLAPRALAGL
jgi:CubicO group peptidase (beta-lactamase class C family)